MCNFSKEDNDRLKDLEDNFDFSSIGHEFNVVDSAKEFFFSIPSEEFKFRVVKLYKYDVKSGPQISSNTRKFCSRLIARSSGKKYFTKSDIDPLSNAGFGPNGSNSYDIFKWRGGVHCRHKWVRYLYDTQTGNIVKDVKQPVQPAVGYIK